MNIDEIIHQPVRTKIIAYLVNNGASDYSTIKKELTLTDGHMSTHMKKLIEAEYVSFSKTFENNKPKTSYKITRKGKNRFMTYLDEIKSLIQS